MKLAVLNINRVSWPPAGTGLLGRLPELPSVSGLACTVRDFVNDAVTLVSEPVADTPPLLVPPALRARLAAEAAHNGMSIDEWAEMKLTLPASRVHAGVDGWQLSTEHPHC